LDHDDSAHGWHAESFGGLHLAEWAAEAAGTAILMFVIVSVVTVIFSPGSWVAQVFPAMGVRLLLAGLLIAGSGSLVAVSPLGRLSGGHINPAVTLGFWLTGHVHRNDLAGYVGAQFLGAVTGAALGAAAWGGRARAIGYAATHPGHGLSDLSAAAIEAAMTAALLLVIFTFTSRRRLMRWTPVATWILVAGLVWQVAPYTGASLNPARSVAPAIVAHDWRSLWIYLCAPPLGSALAALLVRAELLRLPLTAKLFYDSGYRSVMKTSTGTMTSGATVVSVSPPAPASRCRPGH
jgi:aquaporin Z